MATKKGACKQCGGALKDHTLVALRVCMRMFDDEQERQRRRAAEEAERASLERSLSE